MTKINKMIMHGFKSFANKTEILFGDDFNCVLGPNGSGKSNIIDSLCFVLGRSSSKSLRAEKSANLIYNGGKKKKPSGSGEVSIYFDNSKNIFPVDDEEIKITRIVKKSGNSVYKINNKNKSRQEVVDLLSVANINPDGFNIVLQGDIIRFVEMSSIERRKIVEEIAGISVYEEKKDKALRNLNRVDEKLKEAEIILTERKTYLHELKKERDQAMRYKELSQQVNVNKASYVYKQIEKKESRKGELDDKIKDLKEKFDKTQKEINEHKAAIDNSKKEIQEITKEVEEKGEKEQVAVQREIEQLKVGLATNKTKADNFKNELVKIKQRKNQLQSDYDDNNKETGKLKGDIDKLVEHKNAVQENLSKIEAQLQQFKQKKGIDSVTEIDKEIEQIDKEAEGVQRDIQQLREKQQNLLRDKDRIEFQVQSLDEKINKVKEVEKANKDQVEDLKRKKQEFKKSILDLNQRLTKDSELAAQLANSRRKLVSSQEELSRLQARNVAVTEQATGNIAVKKIVDMKAKKKGIYGTVSELGDVNSRYSLALEVAAGNRLQSVVVEDDKVAAECIKYLKDNKLGIASFIPLNKIKPPVKDSQVDDIAKRKGVHDFATNLVSYDPKFKNVFEYVFGNTIVVDNIDVARAIGIGKARMVTLDGDLAEHSGVMRGGFRQKRAGLGFKEKEITKSIGEHEKSIQRLQAEITDLEDEREKNEKQIIHLREFKANLEGDIIKLEKTLHLEAGDITVTKDNKAELQKRSKEVEAELETVIAKISEFNKGLASNKIKRQELRSRISSLRNPTVLAELNAFEEKRQELKDKIVHLNSERKNIDAQISMVEAERDKIQGILKQHDKELENFQGQITLLGEAIKKGESALREKEDLQKGFYAKFKTLFGRRNKINEQIQKTETKIDAMREVSRQTEIKMNTLSLDHAKIVAELAGLQAEFSQYEGVRLDTKKAEEELKRDIDKFERMVQNMDAVNMKALEIYEIVEKEYGKLLEKKDVLSTEKDDVLKMIEEIEEKKKDMFMKTLEIVNKNFQNFFSRLTTKGEASLLLENPGNPFEEGLRVMVKLTGNKFMDIRSLSGGEKTLTALAFIFSIQEHEPHSFYILDEVDAALDKRNSEKLAKLVRQYVDKAQYIVISHNDALISEADNLYGISMDEFGISKVTSLKI